MKMDLNMSKNALKENDTVWGRAGFSEVGNTTKEFQVSSTAMNILCSNLTTVFLPVVYIIIFIVGLPTNTLAIWVFIFRTKKKHPASILLVNLALADLLFIIWLPLKIAYHFNGNNWIFGEPLCKMLVVFFYGNMYCSAIFIACISVQRYWAIVHPFSQQKRNNRVAVCVSVCVWFTVWLITVPLYLYDHTLNVDLNETKIRTCSDVHDANKLHYPISYFLTMGIVGYVVPSVVCTVTSVKMLFYFRSSSMSSEGQKGTNGEKKRKAIILITTVLVMFLVCFTPSNIVLIVSWSHLASGLNADISYSIYIFTLCLSSLNSCLDPFVYYLISKEFRKQVKNTLMCRSERTAERKRVTDLMISNTTM